MGNAYLENCSFGSGVRLCPVGSLARQSQQAADDLPSERTDTVLISCFAQTREKGVLINMVFKLHVLKTSNMKSQSCGALQYVFPTQDPAPPILRVRHKDWTHGGVRAIDEVPIAPADHGSDAFLFCQSAS